MHHRKSLVLSAIVCKETTLLVMIFGFHALTLNLMEVVMTSFLEISPDNFKGPWSSQKWTYIIYEKSLPTGQLWVLHFLLWFCSPWHTFPFRQVRFRNVTPPSHGLLQVTQLLQDPNWASEVWIKTQITYFSSIIANKVTDCWNICVVRGEIRSRYAILMA